MIRHSSVCRGGACGCCPDCREYSYAAEDGRCIYCHPPSREAPVVAAKTKPPKVKANGHLVSIKPNSRSRAPEAKRREALYGKALGLDLGADDDDINHA